MVSFGGNPGSAGTHLATIGGIPGGGQLTNVAFGGSDHKTLYITVQGSSQTRRLQADDADRRHAVLTAAPASSVSW